ncbi:MAG: hypothetical protein PHW27_12990 [Melioribacteraceae bacterium]|nr:hypothetical protein [Melioribacteraceae bacterium]
MQLRLFKIDYELEAADKRRRLQALFSDDELNSIAQAFDYQYNRCYWELRHLNSLHWLSDIDYRKRKFVISKQRKRLKYLRDKFRSAKRKSSV